MPADAGAKSPETLETHADRQTPPPPPPRRNQDRRILETPGDRARGSAAIPHAARGSAPSCFGGLPCQQLGSHVHEDAATVAARDAHAFAEVRDVEPALAL